ncbi:AMP-binding protein [Chloroflexota bacterium]
MLIGEMIRLHAINYPDKLALVDEGGTRLTWKGLNERINRLANAFRGLGLAKGQRVAIIAWNCHEFFEFYIATAKAGLISVPLSYRSTPHQILSVIRDSEPKAILIEKEFLKLSTLFGPK